MCRVSTLVEIRSVTSEIRRRKKERKKKKKTTAVKYKPFGIAIPCGLKKLTKKALYRLQTMM